jgi:hypothetical protein
LKFDRLRTLDAERSRSTVNGVGRATLSPMRVAPTNYLDRRTDTGYPQAAADWANRSNSAVNTGYSPI